MDKLKSLVHFHRYNLLLFALVLHLFSGLFFENLAKFPVLLWMFNMFLLGITSMGIFAKKGKFHLSIRTVFLVFFMLITIAIPSVNENPLYKTVLYLIYMIFFISVFWEILKFLMYPSYINSHVISAAICGYLLLIEISTFLMMNYFNNNPHSFRPIDQSSPMATFSDMVYYCAITLTSIGFGDIVPINHQTKLFTALFGIIGQFYIVVLVGILISKFSSVAEKK
ncbi:MAG: potassium channel family protein [Flavobacterium sp.]